MAKKTGKRITTKKVQASESKPFVLPTITPRADDDEGAFESDGLKTRWRLFVAAYVGPAGGNASLAAQMAGYPAENRNSLAATASRLLRNAKVSEAVGHAFAKVCDSPEWVRASIMDMARVTMAHFVNRNDKGELTLDAEAAEAAAAIGLIKEYQEEGIKTDDGPEIIKRKIKIHDRVSVLALAAKLQGILIEKHEHSGEVKFNPITLDGDKQANTD